MSSLVLVHFHGLTATPANFEEQIRYSFPVQEQRAIPYLQYVHQNTSGVALIQEITDQLSALLSDAYPKKTFVFHGNSAGGTLALDCATHPDLSIKTSGLILNCSAGLAENLGQESLSIFGLLRDAKNEDGIKSVISGLVQCPSEKIPTRLIEEIQGIVLGDDYKNKLLKIVLGGQVFKKYASETQQFFTQQLQILKQQQTPVMIIGGMDDTVTSPETIKLMADIVAVDPYFFQTGHVPHIQEHEKFNILVQKFLEQIQNNS